MNTPRKRYSWLLALAACSTLVTACGTDVAPPASDVGNTVIKTEAPPVPSIDGPKCAESPLAARAEHVSLCLN